MAHPILSFHGAARGVTGSCFRLQTGQGTVLIDCGMFQGSKTEKALNYRPFPFDPARIDAVILTHAHIDHSGLLPKLVKDGFSGPIHATPATVDLCGVMLPDSAHIQESEVEMLNRRNRRRGGDEVVPIYDGQDAARTLEQLRAHDLDNWVEVIPGLKVRFWNAGHLLGSASVEIELSDPPLRLLFSGDIGPDTKLLQPDPEGPSGVDYVICESTYGDVNRIDASAPARRATLREAVKSAWREDGVLLIPTFAVERAQELIADLTAMMMAGDLPFCPIHVDSPMAGKATAIFRRHAAELENGRALMEGLQDHHLRFTETVEQSRALAHARGFHIILAASGMCEAGRIRHHLKNWIWKEEATLLLVGFQAEGTLGRLLQDGVHEVRIQGEAFPVRARIRSIDLYSGHADGPELAAWVADRLPIRAGIFLTHGEEEAMAGLAARLTTHVPAERLALPALDESFDLTPDGFIRRAGEGPPRLAPDQVARLDWHNDVSRLMLDIDDALRATSDDRARGVLIRRLRRALEEGDGLPPPRPPGRRRH